MKKLLLALLLISAAAAPAQAQDVATFYGGKTVRMVVGIGVGSGYDTNARLLARHLVNHIPGNPAIIVQNQPGAGSLTMVNWIGNTNRETHVAYVWHTAPVQSLDDLASKELIMGAQAPGSSQFDFP